MMRETQAISRYFPFITRSETAVLVDLERYESLLRRWQSVQNLVSRETLDVLWRRHFADSLQLLPLLNPSDQHILDLGSGGGFPALPLAIASLGTRRRFTLVEPIARKASFLRTVARELGLNNVTVVNGRAEQLDSRETPQVITSRALASLDQLCVWVAPLFGPGTRALLHKGKEHGEEIVEARAKWHFDVLEHRSDTDPSGVVLEITHLRRKTSV